MRKSSRPPTADRRSITWEEVGGEREGEGEGEGREGEQMRRPSIQSVEGTGLGVSFEAPLKFQHL